MNDTHDDYRPAPDEAADLAQQPAGFHEAEAVNDPALEALLDEALAVRDVPAGLERRVLAEVRAARRLNVHASADARASSSIGRGVPDAEPFAGRPVVARLGLGAVWAAAAALAIGTALLTLWGDDDAETGGALVVVPDPSPTQDTPLATLETELAELAGYASDARQPATMLDDQIALMDTQLALTASETLWLEGDAWESVNLGAMHSDLDALAFPLDATF